MQNTKNAYVGRISTSREAHNSAFRVKLYITDARLEIVSGEGDEWAWDIAEVTITQVSVDRFHLHLGTEDLYFLPVDTRGFVSNVVTRISDTPVEPHRGWLRRRIEAAQANGESVEGYELDDTDVEIELEKTGRKRHVHEWAEGKAAGVITRRCVGCGQVSIDATGLTSQFESQLLTA